MSDIRVVNVKMAFDVELLYYNDPIGHWHGCACLWGEVIARVTHCMSSREVVDLLTKQLKEM